MWSFQFVIGKLTSWSGRSICPTSPKLATACTRACIRIEIVDWNQIGIWKEKKQLKMQKKAERQDRVVCLSGVSNADGSLPIVLYIKKN